MEFCGGGSLQDIYHGKLKQSFSEKTFFLKKSLTILRMFRLSQ